MLEEENRQLCADNMERYAFVSYEGKIVMILPVGVTLNKETLVFAGAGETDALLATVTPENALIKDVIWKSSDETVAKVDENGVVTAVGAGEAVITVTTVSPYRATDVCAVKVAVYHRLTTSLEKPGENGSGDEGTEEALPGITEKQDGNNAAHGSVKAQRAETVSDRRGTPVH